MRNHEGRQPAPVWRLLDVAQQQVPADLQEAFDALIRALKTALPKDPILRQVEFRFCPTHQVDELSVAEEIKRRTVEACGAISFCAVVRSHG